MTSPYLLYNNASHSIFFPSVFIYVYIICYIYYCFCTCYEMATIKAKRNIIREEEKFSEEVRKFRVLYSKQHSDHKDKHVLNNAWSSVDQALGLEEGSFYFILRPLVVSFLLCFFVSLFVYSFVPSFVLSFVGSFVCLFSCLFVCLLVF